MIFKKFYHLLIFFHMSNHVPIFYCYFFLLQIIFKIDFVLYNFILLPFLSYQIYSSFLLLLFSFYFGKFSKLIFFSISFFNIKLVDNWDSCLNPSLIFNGFQVLKINSGLRGSPKFVWFFFFLFQNSCFFNFILKHLFN